MIAKSDNQLYRAYLLKEKLRLIFQIDDVDEAEKELIAWVKWARHCRIPEFVGSRGRSCGTRIIS